MTQTLPLLVTFDGEARSGKGTIVQFTKDYLRDERGYKVMLIDRGQTFRVLVVAARQAGIDLDQPREIDKFLSDETNITNCVAFVKTVYRMSKEERDALLYTNEVSEDSALIGARAASQDFVRGLTKKWLHDAGREGFEIVLVDGRALESIAREMDAEGLCEYRLGLYFTCDSEIGARRTLGLASRKYTQLNESEKRDVDALIEQIHARNRRDQERAVERLSPPVDAPVFELPDAPTRIDSTKPMVIFDTSADMTKDAMSSPIAHLVAQAVGILTTAPSYDIIER